MLTCLAVSGLGVNDGIDTYDDQLGMADHLDQYPGFSTQLNGATSSDAEILSGIYFPNTDYPVPTVDGDSFMDVDPDRIPGTGVAGGPSINFDWGDYEGEGVPGPSQPPSGYLTNENCWECNLEPSHCDWFPEEPLSYRYVR